MNTDGSEHMDAVDLLLKLAVFACFVLFGVCLWLFKQERDKRKSKEDRSVKPPRLPEG
jgi:hypothetical protein